VPTAFPRDKYVGKSTIFCSLNYITFAVLSENVNFMDFGLLFSRFSCSAHHTSFFSLQAPFAPFHEREDSVVAFGNWHGFLYVVLFGFYRIFG
jgi:hypothetical protein